MPNNYILKDFDGGAQKTSLTASMNNSATSFSVSDGSTFPPGSNPFVVVIDRGLATEEKILIASRLGNSFNVLERAYDGSSAQNHALGAVVEHVLDAFTVEQANRLSNLQTTKGDVIVHDGTTTQRLGVGSNDTVLVADSAQASGVKWGQVEANSISAGAISAIATQVESLISPSGVPAGIITQFAGTTAPTGWLLCEGQSVSTTTYASLFAAIGYQYGGSGSTFTLPNLKGRVPVGKDSSQGEFDQLGETGGAKAHSLIVAEMPGHKHDVAVTVTSTSSDHTHPFERRNFTDAQVQSGSGAFVAGPDDGSDTTDPTNVTVTSTATVTETTKGSGTAHNNLQPYIVVNYIIKA